MDAIDNRPDSSRRGFFQMMILGFFALFGIGCIVRAPGPRRARTTRVRRGRRRGRGRGATVRTSRRTQRGRRGRGSTVRTSRRRTRRSRGRRRR